eukprot:TRINITY_DN11913_c0_g1_i1.p1 TRINITY_DN11913_c0_g1~~TRINITY_DN11913_c0_g1_i1.p1  ORF type:complete len:219 (-),score=45.12 TRINITY_DN11913_c0_g1_i1:173-829(-)
MFRATAGISRACVFVLLRRSKVYTRTGDAGTTGLLKGGRRPKNDRVIEALGSLDEVGSSVGLARSFGGNGIAALGDQLVVIQSWLLDAGACVAVQPRLSDRAANETAPVWVPQPLRVDPPCDQQLEQWIDQMETELPPLTNFILAGGGLAASQLHVARSVTRRAERVVMGLVLSNNVDTSVGKLVNRLSDYFFVAARFVALKDGQPEVLYRQATRVER